MSTNHGGGLKDTNTHTNKEMSQMEHDGRFFGSVRPGVNTNWVNTVSHHIDFNRDGVGTSLCRVDFTQHQFYSEGNILYLVFISGQEHGYHDWAFLEQANDTQNFKIYTCRDIPMGPIKIIDSRFMYVACHSNDPPYAGCHTDPNMVYQNFKQDCHYFDIDGVTYEQYIVSIIDKIISQSDCAEISIESADPETFQAVNTNFEHRLNTVDMGGANCLPLKIQGNFALALDDHTGTSPSHDHSIPNKTMGFLFQEPGNFQFTGPDVFLQVGLEVSSLFNMVFMVTCMFTLWLILW